MTKTHVNLQRILDTYSPEDITPGIVHLGLGAFMRAHLAVYTDKVMNLQGPASYHWGICAANIRSNADIVTTLQKQNCVYNVAEYRNADDLCLRQVSSIREVMFSGGEAENSKTLLNRLSDEAIKIVTLSVTEKGYCLNPADGSLLADNEHIVFDLAHPHTPRTAIGILSAALHYRFTHNMKPFTILSCDNMPGNGKALKSALLQFTAINQQQLSRWIEAEVSCPSSMVDRIVPAMSDKSLQQINEALAQTDNTLLPDNAAVACEHFSQWVIEDDFSQGRPDWHLAGAQFVEDVAPFETMKLRLLNGSHSLLAYLGNLGQLQTVAECMNNADYVSLISHYMQNEAIPTLDLQEEINLPAYVDSLLNRFRNGSLNHKTRQIAMDGSLKIPQRWLAGTRQLLAREQLPEVTALGIAAWLRYITGVDEQNTPFKVDDPMADTLKRISDQHENEVERVYALLHTPVFAGSGIGGHPQFVRKITDYYLQLSEQGTRQTVTNLVKTLQNQETQA